MDYQIFWKVEKIHSKQKNTEEKRKVLSSRFFNGSFIAPISSFRAFLESWRHDEKERGGGGVPSRVQPLNDRWILLNGRKNCLWKAGERRGQIYQSAPIHGNKMKFCSQGFVEMLVQPAFSPRFDISRRDTLVCRSIKCAQCRPIKMDKRSRRDFIYIYIGKEFTNFLSNKGTIFCPIKQKERRSSIWKSVRR